MVYIHFPFTLLTFIRGIFTLAIIPFYILYSSVMTITGDWWQQKYILICELHMVRLSTILYTINYIRNRRYSHSISSIYLHCAEWCMRIIQILFTQLIHRHTSYKNAFKIFMEFQLEICLLKTNRMILRVCVCVCVRYFFPFLFVASPFF